MEKSLRRCVLRSVLLSATLLCSPTFGQSFGTTPNTPYVGADGWTVITPTPTTSGTCAAGIANGSCAVYIANTGNDGTCALVNLGDTSKPCATILKGLQVARHNAADWMLLNRGDTWNEAMLVGGTRGLSPSAPFVISNYGTGARPINKWVGPSSGDTTLTTAGGVPVSIAIIGLKIYAEALDPTSVNFTGISGGATAGIGTIASLAYMLVEDCYISYYTDNIGFSISGQARSIGDVSIRRNIIDHAYATGAGHAQGIFSDGAVGNVLYEENLIYHNGYYDGNVVVGSSANVFNHNSYVDIDGVGDGTGPITSGYTYRRNISINDAAGWQGRSGGTWDTNLWSHNPQATNLGMGINPIRVVNNVVTNATDLQCQPTGGCPNAYGQGFQPVLSTVTPIQGGLIDGNIISNELGIRGNGFGISVGTNIPSLTISNNIICNVDVGISIGSGSTVTQSGNQINLPTCAFNSYPFPNRSVLTYDSEILGGPGTLADFVAKAMTQSKATGWNPAYGAKAVVNYIRAGFNLAPI